MHRHVSAGNMKNFSIIDSIKLLGRNVYDEKINNCLIICIDVPEQCVDTAFRNGGRSRG